MGSPHVKFNSAEASATPGQPDANMTERAHRAPKETSASREVNSKWHSQDSTGTQHKLKPRPSRLQWRSHAHTQDPVTVEHDTAHTVLSSFINGTADENLLPSHTHSYLQHSDAPYRSSPHQSLNSPRRVTDHSLTLGLGKPQALPGSAFRTQLKRLQFTNGGTTAQHSTTRLIQRMMMAGLRDCTARAVSRWRQKQQQPVTRHTTVSLQDAQSTPCTCNGRKCQPAKFDTAHGSHIYNCELVYKWHEHGTRISQAPRREDLCKLHWFSAPSWPAVTSSTIARSQP